MVMWGEKSVCIHSYNLMNWKEEGFVDKKINKERAIENRSSCDKVEAKSIFKTSAAGPVDNYYLLWSSLSSASDSVRFSNFIISLMVNYKE